MKRAHLLAALCLALALPAFAAPAAVAAEGTLEFTVAVDPAALLAAAPAPALGEDGLVIYEAHHYRYADGLMSHRHQRLLRVTTEWALERLADPRLRFDSARQKIVVHAARTYFPGGGFIDSPANAFNTVTPGELALAPDFLDIQELVITHVGLEPGCFLWLDTEKIDTAPAGLPEGALLFPQGEFPVLAMDVTAEGLYAELVNPEGGLLALPAGTSEGLRHAWHFDNLPAAPGQATYRLGDQLPHLVISPLESWEQVTAVVEKSLEAAVTDTTGLGSWLAAVEDHLERPILDDRDALDSWLTALGEKAALLDGPDWEWRPPRSVGRTLETCLATPLERTALLIAACRTRGIPVTVLLQRQWPRHDRKLLALAALDMPLVRVGSLDRDGLPPLIGSPAEGRLDVFRTLPRMDCYVLEGGHGSAFGGLNIRPMDASLSYYWNLESGAYAVSGGIEPGGDWEGNATPETALRSWATTWGDSCELGSIAVQVVSPLAWKGNIIRMKLAGTCLPASSDEAGRIRVSLPVLPVDLTTLLPAGMNRGQSSCRAVLFPTGPATLHLSWVLDLPKGFDAVELPPIDAKCPGGRFLSRRELDGRRLTVHYDLGLVGLPIPPADYPAFRALMNAALDPKTTEVLLVPRARD